MRGMGVLLVSEYAVEPVSRIQIQFAEISDNSGPTQTIPCL